MKADASVMVVMTVLFLVSYAWLTLLTRVLRGKGILAFEPRRATPWGVIAVGLSFFILIGSELAVGVTFAAPADANPNVSQTFSLLLWTAVAILVANLASIGVVHFNARADSKDLGISLGHVPRDVFIGIYAFLILAPVTFAIQYVFVFVFGMESHHPLIEMLKQDTTGKLFGIVTVLAVVVAPISEEYFFRVLLQGWLERFFLFRTHRDDDVECMTQTEAITASAEAAQGAGRDASSGEMNPYKPPLGIPAAYRNSDSGIVSTGSIVPILLSAAFFALMHWSHGPDPAALFVLAVGLGFVYQRTHRWLPSVVTHACLNGTTMLVLWFGLDQLPS